MAYKLLAEMYDHADEPLEAVISAKSAALQGLLQRLAVLEATPALASTDGLSAPGSGFVASRVRILQGMASGRVSHATVNEGQKLREEAQKVGREAGLLWNEIMALKPTAHIEQDGTVRLIGRPLPLQIQYDNDLQKQNLTRIEIRGGVLYKGGAVLRASRHLPTNALGNKAYIYVMSPAGTFHVGEQKQGVRHHSSFFAGGRIACGGELQVNDQGRITWISNNSGHYLPNVYHFLQVLHELAKPKNGVNVNIIMLEVWTQPPGQPLQTLRNVALGTLEYKLGFRRGFEETYAFQNLLVAYGDFLNNAQKMAALNPPLQWRPTATPAGVYRNHGGAWAWVPSKEAREILNATVPGRVAGQKQKGIGVAGVAADPTNDHSAWNRA